MFEYDEYIELKIFIFELCKQKIWQTLDPAVKRVLQNDMKYFQRRLGSQNSIAEMNMPQTNKQADQTCQNKKPDRKKYYAHPISLEYAQKELGYMPASDFSVEDYIIQKELCQALYDAISTLDEKDKQIIILYYFQGLPERSVAQRLGMEQKTVNNRKRKVLNILKELLKEFA